MTELWNTIRVPVAFLVAPLAAPTIVVLIWSPILAAVLFNALFGTSDAAAGSAAPVLGVFLFTLVPTFVAYPIMFVIGVPLYRIMIKKGATEFWVAPATGFGLGWVFFLILALLTGSPSGIVLLAATSCGAAVGAIFWLIARPDRQQQPMLDATPASRP